MERQRQPVEFRVEIAAQSHDHALAEHLRAVLLGEPEEQPQREHQQHRGGGRPEQRACAEVPEGGGEPAGRGLGTEHRIDDDLQGPWPRQGEQRRAQGD